MYEALQLEKTGYVTLITFRNPPVNLLNLTALAEIKSVFEELALDPDVRAIVFTAQGSGFIAGADVNSFGESREDDGTSKLGQAVLGAVENCPIPVIAAVNGYCLGGGIELIMCCDIRLASEKAYFSFPELRLGFPPTWGGSTRLTQLIGEGQAKLMLLSADKFSAAQAERMGLVQYVYPQERLMTEALELAERISLNAPIAMRILKKHMLMARNSSFEASMKHECDMAAYIINKYDYMEGIQAFRDKRAPSFENR